MSGPAARENPETRSRTMRAVKGKDTGPEMAVRRAVHAMGYRYRLHRADLPGKPDLAFPARRKVVFVHGCFWHMHDCPRGARMPRANRDYWTRKLERNRARDAANRERLREAGWDALVVWECEIGDRDALRARLAAFLEDRAGEC